MNSGQPMVFDWILDEAPIDAMSHDTGLTVRELKAMLDRVNPANLDRPLGVLLFEYANDHVVVHVEPVDVLTRQGRCVFLQPDKPDAPLYIAVRLRGCDYALAVPAEGEATCE